MAESNREVDTDYNTTLEAFKNQEYDFVDPDDHQRIVEMAHAYNADNVLVECPDDQSTKSKTSMTSYLRHLKRYAREIELTGADSQQYRKVIQGMLNGDIDGVKESGLSENTVNVQIAAIRAFVRVHDDSTTESDELPDLEGEDTSVDPSDMFTREEIQAIRKASDNLRDKALIDFLLYTGQRSTATRTLRIKDLDLDKGRFRLNPDAKGLKGAKHNGKWRDLLLAESTIHDWLDTGHPEPDNPDAVVFTALPSYNRVDPERPINSTTLYSACATVAEKASEEQPDLENKPTNPHAYRHNFVTIALRRGLDEATIKHQIGHAPSSRVMRTTYSHLQDSDHITRARQAFEKEVEEPTSELTPSACPKCGESPPSNAKLCPWCGLEFTPDAKETMEETEEQMRESYKQIDNMNDAEKLQTLDELLEEVKENPELQGEYIDAKEE